MTLAGDWWLARQRGERLSEHELRCMSCGEPTEAEVCGRCVEAELEATASGGSVA